MDDKEWNDYMGRQPGTFWGEESARQDKAMLDIARPSNDYSQKSGRTTASSGDGGLTFSIILFTGLAGLAFKSWWVFGGLLAGASLLAFLLEKFFETKAGKTTLVGLRYGFIALFLSGALYFSIETWGQNGFLGFMGVVVAYAILCGLNYFFSKTQAGLTAGVWIARLFVVGLAIFCAVFFGTDFFHGSH